MAQEPESTNLDERDSRKRSVNGFSTITFVKRDDVAWVTLNRPDQLNAYNMRMRDDLYQVLLALYEDHDVRAMVLAGAGRAFFPRGGVSGVGTAPSPVVARCGAVRGGRVAASWPHL